MDRGRFDAVARAVGRGATRRQGLAGTVLAMLGAGRTSVAGAGSGGPAAAGGGDGRTCSGNRQCATRYCAGGICRCKPNFRTCGAGRHCCSGTCVEGRCDGGCVTAGGACEREFDCCTGMVCRAGQCRKSAEAACSGRNCPGCCEGTMCRPGGTSAACGTRGQACRACAGRTPACRGGTCAACGGGEDCGGSTPVCEAGRCVACRGAATCAPDDEGCIAAVCTCGANGACNGPNPLCCSVLGAVTPVAAPGYRLQMTQLVWAPGSTSAAHSHPIAQVACVQSGALAMTLQQGSATVTRGGTGSRPASSEKIPLNTEVVIGPRDCIAYDEFDVPTIHTVWNASDGETVLWMSDLVKDGERYTSLA